MKRSVDLFNMNKKVGYFNLVLNISHRKLEICRLCGEKSLNYIPIFEDKENYILEKISRCLPIIIFPNDNLPSNVCTRCLHYLNLSCKLIHTSVEVDNRLRMQLGQGQKDAILTDQDIAASCEGSKMSESTNTELLKELKRRAIDGPIECDLCDLNFQDVDAFDKHMEQFHFLKWRCNLCDNSFYESNELITHKALKHKGNVAICHSCQHTIGQNNKRKITNKNVQNNKVDTQIIIDEKIKKQIIDKTNIQKDQNKKQKITDETNVQNDQDDKQEITDGRNVQNNIQDQNNTQEITDKKNMQNDQQETVDENNYEKGAVTFTLNGEMAASSINLQSAMEGENDVEIEDENDVEIEDENDVEIEGENDPMQALVKQTDDNSDSDTVEVIEKDEGSLERLETQRLEQRAQFFCDSCKLHFGNERHFKAHNKIHEERPMTCTICSAKCSSGYELFLHKRAEHNEYRNVQLRYICDHCGEFFIHSWHWEAHNESKCSKMVSKCCKYCNTVFTTRLKLTRHLRIHKSEMFNDPTVTIYKCVSCPKVFVDKEFYESHRNVHDPECWDNFRCATCDQPFSTKFRLQQHQASHQNVKPHQCDICGRSFMRLASMKVHHKIHLGHQCNRCDAVFKKKLDLTKHIRETHDLESSDGLYARKSFICKFCGQNLRTYQSLLTHERIHTGEMPYSCPICHQSFRSYSTKWTHVQHHQKGTFMCEHCGKCFSYKRNLRMHIQTHLPVEDRKYQCSVCGKKFGRNSSLTIHKRIHNGIRPYQCDVCSVRFTQQGDMKRHRMRHFKKDELLKTARSEEQT